jgi:hypothetical protein
MAQLFPSKQTFVDLKDDTQVLVSTVKILSSTSDHLELPNAIDAAVITPEGATDPAFYIVHPDGATLAIDGATVGTEYIVVSNHLGGSNFFPGRAQNPDVPK